MSDLYENISQFMEITGLDRGSAKNILKINNYNLERAINYHLECDTEYAGAECSGTGSNYATNNQMRAATASPAPSPSSSSSSGCASTAVAQVQPSPPVPPAPPIPSTSFADANSAVSEGASLPDLDDTNDETVRSPIPPKREKLIMPDDDNFRYRKRRAPIFTVCPLRNFAHEAEMQEQQLNWYMENRERNRNGHPPHLHHKQKRSRLDDLFCPPIDLLFWGSFQAAREHATARNRWLIVNLQDNSDFKSQLLNRDVWPDVALKKLIVKFFVLWQVSIENAEGLRFKAFYHVDRIPYICVVDPRTGEEKLTCEVESPQVFRTELFEFLNKNSFTLEPKNKRVLNPYSQGPSTSKAIKHRSSTIVKSSTVSTQEASSSSSSESHYKKPLCDYHQMSELSEEDQLELAIKNSLKETLAPLPSRNEGHLGARVLNESGSDSELQQMSDEENEAAPAPMMPPMLAPMPIPATMPVSVPLPDSISIPVSVPLSRSVPKPGSISIPVSVPLPILVPIPPPAPILAAPPAPILAPPKAPILAPPPAPKLATPPAPKPDAPPAPKQDPPPAPKLAPPPAPKLAPPPEPKLAPPSEPKLAPPPAPKQAPPPAPRQAPPPAPITTAKKTTVKNDLPTKIILRLSAGDRVQLEWPKTTQLCAIRLYIEKEYPEIAKGVYKLIAAFTRQNILDLDGNITLEEAELHPNCVLHLHTDE